MRDGQAEFNPAGVCLYAGEGGRQRLPAFRAGHQPTPLARRLHDVAAAQAIRAIVCGIEWIGAASARSLGSTASRALGSLSTGFGLHSDRRRGHNAVRCFGEHWLSRRHEMRHGLGRFHSHRRWLRDRRRHRPGRKAVVPGLRTHAEFGPTSSVGARRFALRRQAHDLDDPAAGHASLARDIAKFSLVAGRVSSAHQMRAAPSTMAGQPEGPPRCRWNRGS